MPLLLLLLLTRTRRRYWCSGEVWPVWDAVCVALLSMHLLLEATRVFGPWARAGSGGRGAGADMQTGWWSGGADLHVGVDKARDASVVGTLGFMMLLGGGVRFWRSSRALVMTKRLATKSAPPAVALLLIAATLLAASSSRNLVLHVHTPPCQPSWGQMLANALDQLIALDGTGQHLTPPHARVRGEAVWRSGRRGPDAPRAAWAAHARS
jgi:hypothetical protein